ncbi:MAG: KUP/HAK/KT family potassium transporter, partial [Sediminibacterium sp.]|nr:KUP/HAK/KT family potassium transporter [Sediminibacterium sp.]
MIKDGNFIKKFSAAGFIIALGIIYGDIGTSPLYVFKAIIKNTVISKELIYGSVSCIFWTLTIQTTFKYVILILQADNRGEGGIFSLYTLVRRKVKWLYIPAIIGASMLLADGIITPPISISNAIEGIRNIDFFESIIIPGNNLTVGIVIAIISLLFFFQRFGTKIVGYSFGPVMFIWFTMILFLGVANIVQDISILKALNPYYGYKLLTQNTGGFWLLGAVFLCTTGAEALYSDLGHCGKKNIQFSWMYVKLALVCNYLGQGVWLLKQQGQILHNQNPFYEIMPSWFLLIGVCIATVATIIASQALISGSFTLINEAVNLNFWPRITIKFPSNIKGQLYIPSLNIILCLGCVGIMLWFRKAENMEAAYGFAISTTMIMTTILMSFYMFVIRKWNKFLSCI